MIYLVGIVMVCAAYLALRKHKEPLRVVKEELPSYQMSEELLKTKYSRFNMEL
jgi:hypothetical protein